MALLFNLPRSVQFDAVGELMSGWVVEFYASQSSDPRTVYADSALSTPLGVSVQAGDDGSLRPIYLDETLGSYKIIIKDANGAVVPNGTTDPYFVGPTATQIGRALYPRTSAETGITITDFTYPEGCVLRYGALADDSTDNEAAFARAFAVANVSTTPVEVTFPEGIYRTSTSQNWFRNGITLRALGRVVIRSTATSGSVMQFDAGASANGYLCNMLGDFRLDSTNAGVDYGLYTRNVHHSVFECSARNISQAGLFIQGAVLNTYRFECSDNSSGAFTTTPVNGVRIESSAIISATTACDFYLTIEVASGNGVVLTDCQCCRFTGTSEGIAGTGLAIDNGCDGNTFDHFFMEANGTGDLDCDGDGNIFTNCTAGSRAASPPYESIKSIIFGAVSERNLWIGGSFYAANVESGALHNGFMGFYTAFKVEDNSGNNTTMIWGRQDNTSVSILAAKIPIAEAFTNLATLNSWANTTGTFQGPQYTINRSTNEVIVRGEVGGGSSGTVIATLPAGFRPAKQYTFMCPATAGSADAVVNVQADGDIQHVSGNTTSIDLSGIRFFV